MYPETFEL